MKSNKKPKKNMKIRRLLKLIGILAIVGVLCYCALIGFVYYKEVNVSKPSDYDSIIVLGAQVKEDGQPSVQLQWRLDEAVEMYNNNNCVVVVCGAQGNDEPAPEGEIMKQILVESGLPENMVFAETKSTDTIENIVNAKAILDLQNLSKPLIVTSDYHLPRAMAIAQDLGFSPQGSGSPCKPDAFLWMKNHGREALAWVKYWLVKYLGMNL